MSVKWGRYSTGTDHFWLEGRGTVHHQASEKVLGKEADLACRNLQPNQGRQEDGGRGLLWEAEGRSHTMASCYQTESSFSFLFYFMPMF